MKIKFILESRLETLPNPIVAYHCGGDIDGGSFSLDFFNTGERFGMPPLGPGIYFATSKNIAMLYSKYREDPYLYTVEIPTDGLYNKVTGLPMDLRRSKFGYLKTKSEKYGIPEHKITIDHLYKFMSPKKIAEEMISIGILGMWVNLDSSGQEIAVYDTSIIKVLSRTRLKDNG